MENTNYIYIICSNIENDDIIHLWNNCITINGGTIRINASGDGIDSNGDFIMTIDLPERMPGKYAAALEITFE